MAQIIAPAGNWEQLEASVRSGAHRIYFGCGELNARRNAKGFENPTQVIEYCHARGVKAYAALNILLDDSNLSDAADLIQEVATAGGDGLIIQDMAVYRLAKEICPTLPLHASTQMTIHNIEGAKALEKMGFACGVLARELTFEEIKAIREATSMELEVFVHGALCMSVSGQCYLSSLIGGRSGNRGLCAQPCRLPFEREDGKNFALSLKDMTYLPYLKKLADIGVNCFKIEGRMKRPEYAAAAVNEALKAMEGETPDLALLGAVFARSGFTDGYFVGKRDEDMFGHRVKEDTKDTDKVLPTLSALYRQERQQIPVTMSLTVKKDMPVILTLTSQNQVVTLQGDVPVQAVNRPLTYDFAKECLFKCGGTPYLPVDLKAEIDDGLMVPIPALKKLRKEGLEQLTTQRIQSFKRMTNPIPKMDTESYRPDKKTAIYVVAQNFEQIERVEADRYYLPVKEILQVPQKAEALGGKLFAVLPALSFEKGAWEQQLDALQGLGVTRVQVQNLGALVLAKEKGFTVSGGTGLNILNTLSLEEYKNLGLTDTLLSFELTENAFRHLGGALPRGAVVYGHLPLMRMRACPLKKGKSCGSCKGKGVLIDRKGTKFQLACYERRFTTLFNSVPLYLGDKQLPVDFKVLWFTHESPDRCKELVTMVEKQEKPNFPRTCGLFERTLF